MSPKKLLLLLVLQLCLRPSFSEVLEFDVVVYTGTAGGVAAAVAAAREGATVALLEPRRHLGGMLSGGLGRTDMDRQQHVIGGIAREFFVEAGRQYEEPIAWTFEPKVAEAILNRWVKEAGVEVFLEHRLDSVSKEGSRIVSIETESGAVFKAKIFIDSGYEGDLLARAGVSYTVGREGRSEYGESLAGIKEIQPGNHQLHAAVSPYDEEGNLLPYVVEEAEVDRVGEADNKVQAYCFRVCLTDVESNRIAIPRPEDYDPNRYELLRRYIEASYARLKSPGHPLGISRIPNGKTDVNSGGPISTNLLSASWEYPEANYQRRQEIWDEHLSWTKGLLYFLTNDPSVPETLRQDMQRWGLPKDEFLDTGHWPHQLYIREARRMLGEFVMTQEDLQSSLAKYDSIGMGGYNMDVREVQWVAKTVYRFVVPKKEVLMEGYITVPVEPYEIPYRALLPVESECANLLVTSCVSASHMAFSSLRMEPQFMIMGQAGGVAAALAVESSRSPHQIDLKELQGRLLKRGQILSLEKQAAN